MIIQAISHGTAAKEETKYNAVFTGTEKLIEENDGNWKVGFLSSGTLTPNADMTVDIFLVGGGAGGQASLSTSVAHGEGGSDGGKSNTSNSGTYKYSGRGGGGGFTETIRNVKLKKGVPYNVVVGEGGTSNTAGGMSSFDEYSVSGGTTNATKNTSSKGGSDGNPGQGTTTREFGEETGELYGAGGGSGGALKSSGYTASGAGGAGGSTDSTYGGGAAGKESTSYSGADGAASETWGVGGGKKGVSYGMASGGSGGGGIGAGGGGGGTGSGSQAGGAGAQGIVIIRNTRK